MCLPPLLDGETEDHRDEGPAQGSQERPLGQTLSAPRRECGRWDPGLLPCSPTGAAIAQGEGQGRCWRVARRGGRHKGVAVAKTGATAPMRGDGGSWVGQVTPGLQGTYLSVMGRVGPMGPRS